VSQSRFIVANNSLLDENQISIITSDFSGTGSRIEKDKELKIDTLLKDISGQ
jgi:hypothetical protein